MDRIRKWLIHKLGGITKPPISEPFVVTQRVDIIPICSVLAFRNGQYHKEHISYYKEMLADKLGKELMEHILIEEVTMHNGDVELRAKVSVVRGEEEWQRD